jgi:hypothetical protein
MHQTGPHKNCASAPISLQPNPTMLSSPSDHRFLFASQDKAACAREGLQRGSLCDLQLEP